MATAFIMPRLPDHQQTFGHFHAPPQLSSQAQAQTQTPMYTQPQISPLSTGSNSTSPTSPKSCYGRQKRPLYMPAVLRPSQPPARAVAAKKQDEESDSLKAAADANNSNNNNGLIGAFGRLSRRPTNDSSKSSDSDWSLFPKPTAQPTRRHWKSDTDSPVCDEPSCMRHFNYWTRRHHCRRCGNIFCDSHSAFEIPLDQDANFNPKGTTSRACFRCFNEVRSWRSRANSSSSSDTSSIGSGDYETSGSSPITATPVPGMATPRMPHRAEVVASVPRDWNWSTF